jgi:hypothetical protein
MENTMLIQLTNQKAIGLLHELEELQLIKVLKENIAPTNIKLSENIGGYLQKKMPKVLTNIPNKCVKNGTIFN